MEVVNFGIFTQGLPENIRNLILMLITLSVLAFVVILALFTTKTAHQRKKDLETGETSLFTSTIILFMIELLPIPYAVIFGTRIYSYTQSQPQRTSEMRILAQLFSAVESGLDNTGLMDSRASSWLLILDSIFFLGFLLMVYSLKSLDFDQRVIKRSFGVK